MVSMYVHIFDRLSAWRTGLDHAIVIPFGKCRKAHGIAEKNISCLQGASICIYDDLETF